MTLALLACVLLPQLHGVEGDEPRVFLWPLGSGYARYELRATYGQPEGKGLVRLHDGLDVSTRSALTGAETRSVYALEDGVVKRVYVDDGENYVSGLVVASNAVPGRALLYLHLEKGSLRFAEGDPVRTNQIVGEVLFDDPVTHVEHLHLSRLGGDFVNEPWSSIASLSERNPLALLKPEALGDDSPPVIEAVEGEQFRFEEDDAASSRGTLRTPIPASTGGQPRPIDVLAIVTDSDGGPHPLAPYRMRLTVQDETPQTFWLCLDGPLPAATALCDRIKRNAPPPPRHDYFFFLTNGAPDCGAHCDESYAWQASVGQHTLDLSVEDVAGRQATASTVIEVVPP
jgi:hypothetical protein